MISDALRFLPRKNIKDVNRCIRGVVAHAYENVPFYRNLYDKIGIHPSDIKGIDDLPKLPIISRLELMADGPTSYLRRGADARKLTVKHTTGTTGNPVTVYLNFWEQAFRKITMLDTYTRDSYLKFPLRLADIGPERKDKATTVVSRFGPHTRVRLFRDIPIDEQIELLMKTKPSIIVGRPSIMWLLAATLKEKKIIPPRPKILISNVEMLFDHVRLLLEDVFSCPLKDCYNCEEGGNLAWQCPTDRQHMHINAANVWLEVVDNNGQILPCGKEGHVVITNLYNHTMPFIRYSMGDRAVLLNMEKCSCGYKGPIMRLTDGRSENFIVLPDGREITPRHMYAVINYAFPHEQPEWNMIGVVKAFQIIQESVNVIIVKIVPGPAYSENIWIDKAQRNLTKLHPAMQLKVEMVDDLTPEPGKKFHQVLGKLSSRYKKERVDSGG